MERKAQRSTVCDRSESGVACATKEEGSEMRRAIQGAAVLAFASTLCFSFVFTPEALACNTSNRCYGTASWNHMSQGIKATVNTACLWTSSPDINIASSEIWESRTVPPPDIGYWIEAGLTYGSSPDPTQRTFFWADRRPGYGVIQHYRFDLRASLNTDYDIQIEHAAPQSSTWWVYWNGTYVNSSVDNFTAQSDVMSAGAEVTANNSRVDTHLKQLKWQGSQGNWNGGWVDGSDHSYLIHDADFDVSWVNNPYFHMKALLNQSSC